MKTLLSAAVWCFPLLAFSATTATCEQYAKANKDYAERAGQKLAPRDLEALKVICKDLPEGAVKKQVPCIEKAKSANDLARCM